MDKQKIFNDVRDHLLEQQEQSVISPEVHLVDQVCVYRGPDGLRCAIGALFPDSLYHGGMDENGLGVESLFDSYPLVEGHMKEAYAYDIDDALNNLVHGLFKECGEDYGPALHLERLMLRVHAEIATRRKV